MFQPAHYIRGQTAAAIAESIETAIRATRLAPGAQLPPVRQLAGRLRVSPATVAAAYQLLQSRGVLVAHGRRGTRVSHRPLHRAVRPIPLPPGVRDLADGNPDLSLLPPLGPALHAIDPSACLYGEPFENRELVELMRRDLSEIGVSVGSIAVLGGALDGIERTLDEHLRPGDRVAVEDPGYGNIFELCTSRGLSLVPVAVDREGLIPDQLERALGDGAAALIVTTRAQNPTGAALTRGRAADLQAILRRHPDVLVIEDDHINLVSDVPLYPLHDPRRGRWAYIHSFSKAFNPDLRLAVMTGDDHTLSRVQDRILVSRRWVSHILQRIVYALLSDAGVRAHLQRVAQLYTTRRRALLAALGPLADDALAASGINVWLPVPEETPVVQALLAAGWAVRAGERFRLQSAPAIRITTATLLPEEAPRVAEALRAVLSPTMARVTA